jgi:hypothetical protein
MSNILKHPAVRWVAILVAISIVLAGLFLWYAYATTAHTPEKSDDVAALVTAFGKEIESVPLMGTPEEAKAAMEILYPKYVSRELLDAWKADLAHAPGKRTSNQRPVSIRVSSVRNVGVGSYIVKAHIIEETKTGTTTEKNDGALILLGVMHVGNDLKITEYQEQPGS